MRKVSQNAANAFIAGNPGQFSNTSVSNDGPVCILSLHGNTIATRNRERTIATLAGYPTNVTRERLNGLCESLGLGRPFYQKQGKQFFGDREIGADEWVTLIGEEVPSV